MGSAVTPPPGFELDDEVAPPSGFVLDTVPPLKQVAAPSITPRQPAPVAPVMQSAVDPFAPKQDWIPEQPKMAPPPPPSPVEAVPASIRPELPGPIEKVQVTSPVGQTNAPVPGRIPGMERLGGAAPGVPPPAMPQVGQPPIPRQPMEEYMGPRSDEFVIADEPIIPAFARGVSSATAGAAGGILRSIGESRSGSARPLPSGPNFAGLPGASEQTPAGAMAQSAGEALSAADESVQQTFARDASIKDFMTDPKGAMTDPSWWMDSVGSAAGSMLPMALSGAGTASAISRVAASRILAPEIASAAVKYGPTVAASLAESAQVYGSTYNEARKAGLDSELSREAASLVAAGTGLTAIPAHKVGIFNDQIRSIGRRIATSAAAEGGQEGVQTWWENAIAKTFYDPKRPLMQGVPEAIVGSAVIGGAMGSGGVNEQTQPAPTPEMQQEFAGLERENRAPQAPTAPPPTQPIVSNDIAVQQEQKQVIPPPGVITPPPAGFVVDEEKPTVPEIGAQEPVVPAAEPVVSQVPEPVKVKMSFTDKSVRDFPVNAKRDGDVATITLKIGNRKIGSFTVDKSEWPVKPVDHERVNLWRWQRRELARKKIAENKLGDFEADGADQAERIADAATNALTKVFDIESLPAPGPREEVVQPKPAEAAAPVEDEGKSSDATIPPEAPPSPGPVEAPPVAPQPVKTTLGAPAETAPKAEPKPSQAVEPESPGVVEDVATVEQPKRTYQQVQDEIDSIESRLEQEGKEPERMAPPEANLDDYPNGWSHMPQELASLYAERDAIQDVEDTDIVGGLSEKLAPVVGEKEAKVLAIDMAEANNLPANRSAFQRENWKQVGVIANHALQFALSEGDTKSLFGEADVVLSGDANNPGVQLRVKGASGYALPDAKVIERAQQILNAALGDNAPTFPTPSGKVVQKKGYTKSLTGPLMGNGTTSTGLPTSAKSGDESGTASYAPKESGVANAQPRTPVRPPPAKKAAGGKQNQPRTKTQISRSQIVRDLSESLDGIPVKTGGIFGKALGMFDILQRVIRSRKALDLNTIAHEVGHAVHKYLWGTGRTINSLNQKPLMPFRKELGPMDYDQTKQRPFEGFAEYIRLRMVDPRAAQQAAPRFHAWFERKLAEPANAPIAEALRKAEQRVQDWQKQPGTMKIAASINTQDAEQKKWMSLMERVWSDAIDDRYAIQKAVKELTDAGAEVFTATDAYSMSRLLSGWAEKAQQFLEVAPFDARTLKPTGRSFRDIVKPLYGRKKSEFNPRFNRLTEKLGMKVAGDNLDDLRIYLIAKRAEDYHSQGFESGFEQSWVEEAIAATKTPEVEKAALELQNYQNDVLDYVVEKGGLSEESAGMIRSKNSFYVPMHRVMDNSDVKFSAGGRKMIDAASPIRKRKGGAQEIVDPLESIVKNTYSLISYAERNAVGQSLVKQAARASNKGSLLESGINPGMKITKFNLKEIEPQIIKMMEDAGLDPDDIDMDVVAAIYRPNTKPNKAKNQVVITVDGKPQMFEMHPDIIKAMSVTEAEATHLLEKVLQAPANVLRFGATGAGPEFVLRNPLKDTWAAYMQSRNGFIPIVDTVAGGLAMIFDKDLVNEMVRAGGGGAGIMPMGRKALRRYIDEMMMAKPQYVMRHPKEVLHVLAEGLRWAGEQTERATRVGEYRLARKAGKSAAEAAMDARDVTLDFSRQGSVARKINPYVAFFSASLNGTSRFFEEHAKHPVRSAIRGLVGTTIPTILLWMLNKDDDEYRELENWQKSLFWHIPTRFFPQAIRNIFGPFIPVPRANLYGLVYGNMVERILDTTYKKNPKAFDGFARELAQSATPPVLPPGITQLAETMANYSFFTGQNIDSRTMENLQAQYRSRPATSSTAKAISKTFAELGFEISPLKIEHVYFGMTAGLGRAALWGAERAVDTTKRAMGQDVRVRPLQTMADTPFLRAFATRKVPNSPESVTQFYKRLDELRKVRNSHKSAQAIPNGPAAGARPLTGIEKSELDRMEKASRELAGLAKQASVVQYSKTMNEVEKLNALDRLHRRKVNVARVALGLKEIYRIQ